MIKKDGKGSFSGSISTRTPCIIFPGAIKVFKGFTSRPSIKNLGSSGSIGLRPNGGMRRIRCGASLNGGVGYLVDASVRMEETRIFMRPCALKFDQGMYERVRVSFGARRVVQGFFQGKHLRLRHDSYKTLIAGCFPEAGPCSAVLGQMTHLVAILTLDKLLCDAGCILYTKGGSPRLSG
ncbi:hypothetical protein Tco_0047073 [Tanacetum coccineum]